MKNFVKYNFATSRRMGVELKIPLKMHISSFVEQTQKTKSAYISTHYHFFHFVWRDVYWERLDSLENKIDHLQKSWNRLDQRAFERWCQKSPDPAFWRISSILERNLHFGECIRRCDFVFLKLFETARASGAAML